MESIDGRRASIRSGIGIEWISAAWMVIEATVALIAGVMAHSVSLVAFGSDSIIELAAGGVLLWRLYIEVSRAGSERVEKAEHTASSGRRHGTHICSRSTSPSHRFARP